MKKEFEEVKSALEWIDRIVKFLGPYKPKKKKMRINHVDQTSEIALLLNIPGPIKRKVAKLKVPAYQNFYIYEMMAEDFTPLDVSEYWKYTNGYWILDPKKLPDVDNFFLRLRGHMSPEVISKIVFVEEAKNRDQTEESDRYWLKCMIRDVELIEDVWDMLEIEDVDVSIKVGINRCFSAAIPFNYRKKIEATQKFLRAGHGIDREKLSRAWGELHRAQKSKGGSIEELMDLIGKLTRGEIFGEYVKVERPYHLGAIQREPGLSGPFPRYMFVQALTDLNLKQYVADDYLIFEKKKYINEVKNSLGIEE